MNKEARYELKSDWIEITSDFDGELGFYYETRFHRMSDILRTHNNPWCGGEYPDYIHGRVSDGFYVDFYIEIADSGDCVRVYKRREEK